MVAYCTQFRGPDTPLGARRAMLLLGFGAALRRSELVALTLEVAVYVLNRMLEFGRPSYVGIV
jgi:hypothetical protein